MPQSTVVNVRAYEVVPISILKPDPNQPRAGVTDYDESVIEMAKSIEEHGLLQPIEVDDKNVIVTGELRWRAARKAGLTEIPVRRINVTGSERFARQLVENLQRKEMTPIQVAAAIKKLKQVATGSPGSPLSNRELAKMIGKSHDFVADMLDLAGETKEVKTAISSGNLGYTTIREVNRITDPEIREIAKEKVLKGEWVGRDTVAAIRHKLREQPAAALELTDMDLVQSDAENIRRIEKVAPTKGYEERNALDKAKAISLTARKFVSILETLPLLEVPDIYRFDVEIEVRKAQEAVDNYLINAEER